MNNKIIASALLLMAAASPVFAQSSDVEEKVEYSADKHKVETNRFGGNWFISVGAGGLVYFGDHDKQVDFGKRISPALDIAVGKWFTPGIGARLVYSGLSAKGATKMAWTGYENAHSTGEVVPGKAGDGFNLEKSKFKFFDVHADVLLNFSNLFCGYNPKRVWNSSPYVGLGFAYTWQTPTACDVTMSGGWLNTFRLCDALDLNLDLRATMMGDRLDGEMGEAKFDGMFSATLGLTYKFKPRGWERSKTVTRVDNSAINEMREKLNAMSEENDRLRRALAEGDKKGAETIVKKMAVGNLVTFRINKSNLSKEARANLGLMAEVIKSADPNTVYTITGYADAGTGSEATNERLSKERAQAVYDCLVEEFGVNKSQLRIDYKGGVDNMFYDDPRLSRAVITKGE